MLPTGRLRTLVPLLTCLALGATATTAEKYKAGPGPHKVETVTGDWTDDTRMGRVVPWKAYLPRGLESPAPVVIWSHGAGGSRDGAEYLGRHLASHGYVAFHVQHPGSDATVLRRHGLEGMLEQIQRPEVSIVRFGDLPFVVDRLRREAEGDGPLAGRVDVERMGISGHSFGAISALVAAGQAVPGGDAHRFAVPTLRGAFAMSPSWPRRPDAETAFVDMLMPILHVTGTADASPLGDQDATSRTRPFRVVDDVDQWLLVLEDAVHMTFSGRPVRGAERAVRKAPRHHELVRMAATAFWDAVLLGDETARAWLDGGLADELGREGALEVKPAARD